MREPVLWILVGISGALLGMWIQRLGRRRYRLRRYGAPIPHEELLVDYGRKMAGLHDEDAISALLAEDVPETLGVPDARVLLTREHDLVAADDSALVLSDLHAAVRWVASAGEAVRVRGRLYDLIVPGRSDLEWTAVWVPVMRGATLYAMWLLGERAAGLSYSSEDLRWLTTIARQAAVVLETIRYAEQEQQHAIEMRALYRQAVAARESERARLSRELHDGVLQDLCAVARDLKALTSESEMNSDLETLVSRSDESVRTLRGICHDLRPPLLSNNPAMALKALVERLDAQSPAPIHIEISADNLNVSDEAALAIYRIVQEALHNSIQHADASEIAVRITQYPDRLRLTVTDDGRGILGGTDVRRFIAEGHYGMAGMRERAAMIGGSLDVQTAPDYGTVVILEIPV